MDNTLCLRNPRLIECGSASEGGCHARSQFYAVDGKTERDALYVFAELNNKNLLKECISHPVYVKVLYDGSNKELPYGKVKTANIKYINGFKCKQLIANIYYPSYAKKQHSELDYVETENVELVEPVYLSKANIYYITSNQINDVGDLLNKYEHVYLTLFKSMTLERRKSFHKLFQERDMQDDVLEFRYNMLNNSSKGMYNLSSIMLGPIFGISMPNNLLQKLNVLFKFYLKYKSLVSVTVRSGNKYIVYEKDIVPAIELKFWPKIMNWFTSRMKTNDRWSNVFCEKIQNQISVYLVSKWSGKGSLIDAQYEFRYSFSMIELILAQERTFYENQFNFMVKLLYYKYLRPIETSFGLYIPSYFIKTTVAWILELANLTDIWKNMKNRNNINNCALLTSSLLNLWRDTAMNMFKTRYCKHYFIENVNILQDYDEDLLDLAYGVLLSLTVDKETESPKAIIATKSHFYLFEACLNISDQYNARTKSSRTTVKIESNMSAAEEFRQLVQEHFDDSPTLIKYNVEHMNIVLETFHIIESRYPNFIMKWYSTADTEQQQDTLLPINNGFKYNPCEFCCLLLNIIEKAVNIIIPKLLDFGDKSIADVDALCMILDAIGAADSQETSISSKQE